MGGARPPGAPRRLAPLPDSQASRSSTWKLPRILVELRLARRPLVLGAVVVDVVQEAAGADRHEQAVVAAVVTRAEAVPVVLEPLARPRRPAAIR